jgi:hypothetical protein
MRSSRPIGRWPFDGSSRRSAMERRPAGLVNATTELTM